MQATDGIVGEESPAPDLRAEDHDDRPSPGVLAWTRLLLAVAVTLGCLIYPWGRAFVVSQLAGRPETYYGLLFLAALAGVIILNFRLAARFAGRRWHRHLGAALVLIWSLEAGLLIYFAAGELVPRPLVVLLFVPSTYWILWAGWMFYRPISNRRRALVLTGSTLLLVPFLVLLRAEGLTGAARVDFAWRFAAPTAAPGDKELVVSRSPQSADHADVDLTQTTATDWLQFLGPERTGVAFGPQLLTNWSENPPEERWRKPVGAGWSSFAIVGDYAITQEQRDKEECVVCYDISAGDECWRHADSVRFDSSMGGSGPRATPTVFGGRVYALGATGVLNCLDGGTGDSVWSVDLSERYDAEPLSHGSCGSPLIVDDRVIVSPTAKGGPCLVALDCSSGDEVWKSGEERCSYSSPMLVEIGGMRQILLFHAAGLSGFDIENGTVLWSHPWSNNVRVNASQPLLNGEEPGQILLSTGYGTGSVLLDLARSDSGNWSAEPLWTSKRMRAKFTTPVLHGGHVFGLDDGILACINWETGQRRWKRGRYGHGQVLLVGDMLLVQAEDGDVALVKANPEEFIELARIAALGSKTWNVPALSGNRLLVRNDREAICFELPISSATAASAQ